MSTDLAREIKKLRKDKGWTIKDFIERLEQQGGKAISPTYVTKIEVYGEIPSPDVICKIADVLGCDHQKLLDLAKNIKIDKFAKSLGAKYREAVGMYRLSKTQGQGEDRKDEQSK